MSMVCLYKARVSHTDYYALTFKIQVLRVTCLFPDIVRKKLQATLKIKFQLGSRLKDGYNSSESIPISIQPIVWYVPDVGKLEKMAADGVSEET